MRADTHCTKLAEELSFEELLDGIAEAAVSLDDLAELIHAFNIKKGWWSNPETGEPINRNYGDLTALIHTEISESYEAYRKGDIADDKLPQYKGMDVELIDAIIRQLDTLGARSGEMSPGNVLVAKTHFNHHRPDHKPENRAKEGGKKF